MDALLHLFLCLIRNEKQYDQHHNIAILSSTGFSIRSHFSALFSNQRGFYHDYSFKEGA